MCVSKPDGSEVAFIDHPLAPDDRGGIAVVGRQGSVKRLTPYYSTGRSLCWSPDGKEIWFTASMEGSDSGLYAVTGAGKSSHGCTHAGRGRVGRHLRLR